VTTACGPYYEPTTHVYIRREDADFIAAADPTTIRALLAELAAKDRELAEAKAALAAMPAPFKADEGVTQRLLLGTTTDAVRFVVSLFDVPFTSDMIIESLRRRKRLSETAVRSELLRMSSVGLLRREQKPGKRGREWVYQHAPVADVERADHEEHKRMIAGYDGSDSYSDADVPKAPVADGQAQGEDGGEEKTTK
jgi:predicted transcriptional regulator